MVTRLQGVHFSSSEFHGVLNPVKITIHICINTRYVFAATSYSPADDSNQIHTIILHTDQRPRRWRGARGSRREVRFGGPRMWVREEARLPAGFGARGEPGTAVRGRRGVQREGRPSWEQGWALRGREERGCCGGGRGKGRDGDTVLDGSEGAGSSEAGAGQGLTGNRKRRERGRRQRECRQSLCV